jgi:hypothetical protein
MAQFRVTRRSWFADLGVVEPDVIVTYDGRPGSNLEPIDEAGKKAKEEAARMGEATRFAREAAAGMAVALQDSLAGGYTPPKSVFAPEPSVEAPDARRSKSGVLRPADQVTEGDDPGPSPSLGGDLPPDTTTFVVAGVPSKTSGAVAPAAEDEEPAPRRRSRKPAEQPEE